MNSRSMINPYAVYNINTDNFNNVPISSMDATVDKMRIRGK